MRNEESRREIPSQSMAIGLAISGYSGSRESMYVYASALYDYASYGRALASGGQEGNEE